MKLHTQLIVSVIVPFHNSHQTLRRTVLSLINQNFPKVKYEILLVNDGSTDGSLESIKDLLEKSDVKMKVVSSAKHDGCFSARNIGLKNSEGQIVAFIDADEIANESWLRCLTEPLLECQEIQGVTGTVTTDMDASLILPIIHAPIDACRVTPEGVVIAGSGNVAYRKNILLKLGGFDEKFDPRFRGDSDLCLRVLENRFKMVHEPKAIVYHPVNKRTLNEVLRVAFLRHKDALLYSKHGKYEKLVRPHVGTGITKPIFGPLSPLSILIFILGFFTTYAIVARSLHLLVYTIAILFSIWLALFSCYGYRAVSVGTKPNLLLRLKAAFILPLYFFVVFLGRAYGCIKFRSLLL